MSTSAPQPAVSIYSEDDDGIAINSNVPVMDNYNFPLNGAPTLMYSAEVL